MDKSESTNPLLPAPVVSAALVRERAVRELIIKETPGGQLGVSRKYFLAFVEKHDLSLEEVAEVLALRNRDFNLRPAIRKINELMKDGATLEEIVEAYEVREVVEHEVSPFSANIALFIECQRRFTVGGLDGDEFGDELARACNALMISRGKKGSVLAILRSLLRFSEETGCTQLQPIVALITGANFYDR